jgi:hypothetical protein
VALVAVHHLVDLRVKRLPSGKLTWLWKITIFHGKTHYKWPFSIAMLNYQMVSNPIPLTSNTPKNEPQNEMYWSYFSFGSNRGKFDIRGM